MPSFCILNQKDKKGHFKISIRFVSPASVYYPKTLRLSRRRRSLQHQQLQRNLLHCAVAISLWRLRV